MCSGRTHPDEAGAAAGLVARAPAEKPDAGSLRLRLMIAFAISACNAAMTQEALNRTPHAKSRSPARRQHRFVAEAIAVKASAHLKSNRATNVGANQRRRAGPARRAGGKEQSSTMALIETSARRIPLALASPAARRGR